MTRGPEIAGLAAWIILLLPFVVLGAAVLLALRPRGAAPVRNVSGAEPERPGAARGRYGTPLKPATPPAAARTPEIAPEMKRDEQAASGGAAAALARAEAEGRESDLAEIYLAHARELLAVGRGEEAAGELRKSVRIASRIGKAQVHGEGRLELAELARASGDLTTACEHWQIARRLFSDLKLAREMAVADGLMRQHGCPTDWVLNDF